MRNLVFCFSMIIVSAFSVTAQALPGDDCPYRQVFFGKWAFNRFFTMADGCLLQVTPIHKPTQIYREYVTDQSGRLMVFNSTPGTYETATSQRNFFFFPVVTVPDFKQVGERMVVQMANGSELQFSGDSDFVLGTSQDLQLKDNGQIGLSPGGGVEIVNYKGIMLDAGWIIGDRGHRDREAISVFSVPGVGKCRFKNREIFDYEDPITREPYYQPIFKFPDLGSLEAFLAKRLCVQMPDLQ